MDKCNAAEIYALLTELDSCWIMAMTTRNVGVVIKEGRIVVRT